MAVRVTERADRRIVEITVTGKLQASDYQHFVPMIEEAIKQHGKIRVLLRMVDFQGWTVCAAWEDVKFDVRHCTHIERLAMVGEKRWEKGMAAFCRPFTNATIRFFEFESMDQAYRWIEEDFQDPTSQITSCGTAAG